MQPDRNLLRPALRIAMLTHSVNPRGGVVHAMELGDALQAAGHQVTLHAPDPSRRGLFRETRCAFAAVPGGAHDAGLTNMVRQRINDYINWFELADTPRYDIYHAQDTISANALATLTERGVISGFLRTVHHLDQFDDSQHTAWQNEGFKSAARVLCVSKLWRDKLLDQYGIAADLAGNGVNIERYQPQAMPRDVALRIELGLHTSHVFLAVGGIEPRKNTLGILQAFLCLQRVYPQAQLVIAGGASLLDHEAYRQEFNRVLQESGIAVGPGKSLMILGQVADGDMPALFRCAYALVFPSLKEGFGLAVLEAMACGTPAVVSRIAPFTEYLQGDSCVWADPEDPASIAAGMAHACTPQSQLSLRAAGLAISRNFSWSKIANIHLDIYRAYLAHPLEISHA